MVSREERQRIFDRIGQIKNRIEWIKDKLNENWQETQELRDAQRDHRREARKRYMRDVGYQGGDCDRRLAEIGKENSALRDEKDALYREKNDLYEKLKK